ncbi:MAG: hypothetical protein AAFY98_10865 [Verrucomicrobiota bacterium]
MPIDSLTLNPDTTQATLRGRLDYHNCLEMKPEFEKLMSLNHHLILDLSLVEAI